MNARSWWWLVLLSLLWGCSFLFIELALRDLPVLTVAAGRIGIAAAALLPVAIGSLIPILRQWREFVILGALRGAIPVCLIVWAQTRIDSGTPGILNSTSPLFTMLVAHALTKDDRLTPPKILGCAIAMAGVAFMIGRQAAEGLTNGVIGQVAMLGATLSYGFAAVYGRRFGDLPHASSAAGMLCGATVLILPAALVFDHPWTLQPELESVAGLVALAVVSTAAAFVVWFRLITTAGPSNTSLVTFLIPITALVLGAAFLGEQPPITSLAGLGIILAGVAVTQSSSRSGLSSPFKEVSARVCRRQ